MLLLSYKAIQVVYSMSSLDRNYFIIIYMNNFSSDKYERLSQRKEEMKSISLLSVNKLILLLR